MRGLFAPFLIKQGKYGQHPGAPSIQHQHPHPVSSIGTHQHPSAPSIQHRHPVYNLVVGIVIYKFWQKTTLGVSTSEPHSEIDAILSKRFML